MNNLPSSTHSNVPAIRIQNADNSPSQFECGDAFNTDIFNIYDPFLHEHDGRLFHGTQDSQSEFPSIQDSSSSTELEDIPELSHLSTTLPLKQPFFTGPNYSVPYGDGNFLHDGSLPSYIDGRLSPSSLGSSIPSPTSSFTSLSPSSFYEGLSISDVESPVSPPIATPDHPFFFASSDLRSNDCLVPLSQSAPSDSISPDVFLERQTEPQRVRSASVRHPRPVASQAMLEANSRRRRHPAQFTCDECGQTFTALFSLKRHTQSHTGERPFACRIPGCGQRFFNSSDCKRHERSRKRHKDLLMQ